MIKLSKIGVIFLLFACTTTVLGNEPNCPAFFVENHQTMNGFGNSRYYNGSLKNIFSFMIDAGLVDPSKPTLDLGCGYGEATNELLKMETEEVYSIDKDFNNIECMKKYLMATAYGEKLKKLHLIVGDFPYDGLDKKLPDDHFGLIFTRNVIHFLRAQQLIDFLVVCHTKLVDGGILFVAVENNYINELRSIIHNKGKNFASFVSERNMNRVMQATKSYSTTQTNIINFQHCSFEKYKAFNSVHRYPMFPCEHDFLPKQLILPEILGFILEDLGYEIVLVNEDVGKFFIVAKKR